MLYAYLPDMHLSAASQNAFYNLNQARFCFHIVEVVHGLVVLLDFVCFSTHIDHVVHQH